MRDFKDFGINLQGKGFVGDKIEIHSILNEKISVIEYRIVESKFTEKGNGKCLHIQIIVGGSKRVVFTGSGVLMETIVMIPKMEFPFTTTIVKKNKRFEFT